MDELVQWLGEQLDVDAAKARAATPGPWRYAPGKHHHIAGTPLFEEAVFAGSAGADAICVAGTGETDDQQSMRDAAHIAEHDPARVLREIDSKRWFVEMLANSLKPNPTTGIPRGVAWSMLTRIAEAYRDRPGWRPYWPGSG